MQTNDNLQQLSFPRLIVRELFLKPFYLFAIMAPGAIALLFFPFGASTFVIIILTSLGAGALAYFFIKKEALHDKIIGSQVLPRDFCPEVLPRTFPVLGSAILVTMLCLPAFTISAIMTYLPKMSSEQPREFTYNPLEKSLTTAKEQCQDSDSKYLCVREIYEGLNFVFVFQGHRLSKLSWKNPDTTCTYRGGTYQRFVHNVGTETEFVQIATKEDVERISKNDVPQRVLTMTFSNGAMYIFPFGTTAPVGKHSFGYRPRFMYQIHAALGIKASKHNPFLQGKCLQPNWFVKNGNNSSLYSKTTTVPKH